MTEGPSRSRIGPFASTRAQGFLFRTTAFKRGVMALQRAWTSHNFPIILEGPNNIGKKTLVTAWLQNQRRGTITAARLSAADLRSDSLADAVLRAFGQKPADRASAEGALSDYLEDCVFDGRPGFVMISDLAADDRFVWDELLRLAKPRAEGGVGLSVCVTTERAPTGVSAVTLPAMTATEVGRFIEGVVAAADLTDLNPNDVPLDTLMFSSDGLAGRLGRAFDRWFAERAEDQGGPEVAADDVRVPEAAEASEDSLAMSPEEIEAALEALSGDTADEAPKQRAATASFPKIATGRDAAVTPEPANDPVEALAPKMASDLEEVAQEVAGLQGHLIVVRDQAEALRAKLDARQKSRDEAVDAFAQSLDHLRA